MDEVIKAFKGFDKDLKCRGFQYEIGKEYEMDGEVEVCKNGFHACEVPMDVFSYYQPENSRYCVVGQSGRISKSGEDSKVASSKIRIMSEISLDYIIKSQIEFVKNTCCGEPESMAQCSGGHAAAQGNRGHAAAQGDCGHAAAQGDYGHASVKGHDAIAAAFGIEGMAKASLGSWIVCAEWEFTDNFHIQCVKCEKIDGETLKPDTWYMLKNGEWVEADED